MATVEYPDHLFPRTQITFFAPEEGNWVVEVTSPIPEKTQEIITQLLFSGAVHARINDSEDNINNSKRILTEVERSEWVKRFLQSYIKNYGTALLPAVNNVKHFVITSHDMTIGILARNVKVARTNEHKIHSD